MSRQTAMNHLTRHTVRDLIRYIPAVVIPFVLGLVAVALYTRLLSPSEYGFYTLIFSTALFVETLAFSWMNQSILRYYERYRSDGAQRFFGTPVFGFLGISLALAAVSLAALPSLEGVLDRRLYSLAYLLPLVVFCQAGAKLMFVFERVRRESARYSFHLSAHSVIKLLAGLSLIWLFGLRAEGILLGIALAGVLIFMSEGLRTVVTYRLRWRSFDRRIFTQFLRYGFPLLALSIVHLVLTLSDRYLIEYFLDSAQVGIYSAGYRIAETAVSGFVMFLTLASFPALIEAYEQQGRGQARELMTDLLRFYLVLLVPAVVGMTVLSEPIIGVFLGDGFRAAAGPLPWIAAGRFFLGLCIYYAKSFELSEKTAVLPLIYLGPAGLNVLLNLWLIPAAGITGAAVSTFISCLSCFVLMASMGSRFIRWRFPWRTAAKTAGACVLMAVLIAWLPFEGPGWGCLVVNILTGALVYGGAMLLLEGRRLRNSAFLRHRTGGQRG
jgi:O-antigen/teichoic acid export membrane protein